MKAITIIIAAVLYLQAGILLAGNDETRSTINNEAITSNTIIMVPVTPAEATFEDATETSTILFDFSVLAPVTPAEADFPDVVPEKNIDLTILAPVTPLEADFADTITDQSADFSVLAPETPAEADFE